MTKKKVSATVSPERLAQAQELTGTKNVSAVLDKALGALVERQLEQRWFEGYDGATPDDLPGETAVDLADIPWNDPPPR